MVQFDNMTFVGATYNNEAMDTRNATTGAYLKSRCYNCFFYDNIFSNFYTDINTVLHDGDVIGNTFTGTGEDSLDGQWLDGTRIWFNKWLARIHAASYPGDASIHGDYIQNAQATAARVGGTVIANVPSFSFLSLPLVHLGSTGNEAINTVLGYNIVAGTSPGGTGDVGLIDTSGEMLTYYDGPFTGATPTTLSGLLSAFNPKAPASGIGAIGTGVDFTAQTATFPDATTYVRPREAP
jgi:hypothetical protein